jgi:hypothetical protein
VLAQRNARVRAREPELDAVERPLGTKARDQVRTVGGAGAARLGVADRPSGGASA